MTLIQLKPMRAPAKPPVQKHEPELEAAQTKILERELSQRKAITAKAEMVIRSFFAVYPSIEHANASVMRHAEFVRQISLRIAQMRFEEVEAMGLRAVPVPDGIFVGAQPGLLRNVRLAHANRAYFEALNVFFSLSGGIARLFGVILDEDPSLAPMLKPIGSAIQLAATNVQSLGRGLMCRPVRRPVPHIPEADRKKAQDIWSEFLRINHSNEYVRTLGPHEGREGRKRLVYFSIGGLGDALLQAPCVAELKRRFDPCEILVIHCRPSVTAVFEGNRSVNAALFAPDDLLIRMIGAVNYLGIFDLVLESRFVVWAELCLQSRITGDADIDWVTRTQKVAEMFAPCVERFPLLSNLFGRIVRPKMLLDVHGLSTGLPIAVDSPLPLFPAASDAGYVDELGLRDVPYVTVHDGFDETFGRVMGISRCTKQLPTQHWKAIIGQLHDGGMKVVQVGSDVEPQLPDVDVDLRGRTSFSQLCFVLKAAVIHVDTEGGIVHVARAVNKRSIVFFGPTSATFWGYPTNINLCSSEYTDCWWINSDWMARSPIRQETTAMEAFDIASLGIRSIVEQAALEAHERCFILKQTSLPEARNADGGRDDPGQLNWAGTKAVGWIRDDLGSPPGIRIGVLGDCNDQVIVTLAGMGARIDIFAAGEQPADHVKWREVGAPGQVRVICSSPWNLPANSREYDAIVCIEALKDINRKHDVLSEMLRLLSAGGTLAMFERCRLELVASCAGGKGFTAGELSALIGSDDPVPGAGRNDAPVLSGALCGFHVMRIEKLRSVERPSTVP